MNEYIVTVKSSSKGKFDKGIDKFRVLALNKPHAMTEAKKHSMFPPDGVIIKIKEAAYKRLQFHRCMQQGARFNSRNTQRCL